MASSILWLWRGTNGAGTGSGPDLLGNDGMACSGGGGPSLPLPILSIFVPMIMMMTTNMVAVIATYLALCLCCSGKFSSVDTSPV